MKLNYVQNANAGVKNINFCSAYLVRVIDDPASNAKMRDKLLALDSNPDEFKGFKYEDDPKLRILPVKHVSSGLFSQGWYEIENDYFSKRDSKKTTNEPTENKIIELYSYVLVLTGVHKSAYHLFNAVNKGSAEAEKIADSMAKFFLSKPTGEAHIFANKSIEKRSAKPVNGEPLKQALTKEGIDFKI